MATHIRHTQFSRWGRISCLLRLLITCAALTLSTFVAAEWKFYDYSQITPTAASAQLERISLATTFKDSALTFTVEKSSADGQVKWHGMFTSPQAIKSLIDIKTANINPFDSSAAVTLDTINPRAGMMGDGRMVIAFNTHYAALRALSQTKGKLLAVNYESYEDADAVYFELKNFARALQQFEEHIKRAGMEHILTQ